MIDLPKVWLPACELAELPRESGVAFMGPPSHPGSFLSLDSPSVSQEIELFLPTTPHCQTRVAREAGRQPTWLSPHLLV